MFRKLSETFPHYGNALKNAMENIKNLNLARLHNQLSAIQASLHKMEYVDNADEFQDHLNNLDNIVSQLERLAYGDCQFVHHLPYPVKPRVKRGRLVVFPTQGEVA